MISHIILIFLEKDPSQVTFHLSRERKASEEEKMRAEVNARVEKERKQEEKDKEREMRKNEMGRMEIENWRKYQADRDEQVVVEEEMRDGGEDDIEIIGGNGPETLNKKSYVEYWLTSGREEQINCFSDDEHLDENEVKESSLSDQPRGQQQNDIDTDTSYYGRNTAAYTASGDSFEKAGVDATIGEEEMPREPTFDQRRKRGPSKAENGWQPVKRSRKCCGECSGFKRANCDVCPACLDKPRNGGMNKSKQKCADRTCTAEQ